MTSVDAGPLLWAVLEAQREEDHSLQFPNVEANAVQLGTTAATVGAEVLWPVGPGAEVLLGAAAVVTHGRYERRGWGTPIRGRSVLVVATTAVSPLELDAAIALARANGAAAVHACAISASLRTTAADSFTVLGREPSLCERGGASSRCA